MTSSTKRKYVEKEFAEDYSLPSVSQSILKIVKPRGNNLHEVISSTGEQFLVSMPPKFRKNIWVKRGDFVVTEPIHEGQKVKAEIVKILTKDHIKYYIRENVWPEGFKEKESISKEITCSDSDDDIMPNPNKAPYSERIETSSDSDEESENSDDN